MEQRRRMQAETWETVFGVAYLVVGTNAMLVLAAFPLIVLLISTDPASSWPALCVAAVAAMPGAAAAFAVFRAYSLDRNLGVLRGFWAAWWRHLRRSLVLGVILIGAAVVLTADFMVLINFRLGALVIPLLAVLAVLVAAMVLLALVASVERPDARLRDVLKASLYLAVRRWYLTVVSFAALAALGALFVEHPALALGLAAAPLLYAAWGNSRYSLRPVLPQGAAVQL